jgi:hypothetical protein
MVNPDKVRLVEVNLRCASDAIERALDGLFRLHVGMDSVPYITDQLERANEDFLIAVREWAAFIDATAAGKVA